MAVLMGLLCALIWYVLAFGSRYTAHMSLQSDPRVKAGKEGTPISLGVLKGRR